MAFFQPALFVTEGESVTIDATPELQDGSASSYTFSIDAGAARSSRRIFLAIHWSDGGTHRTLSSSTINGVTANRFQEGHSGGATGFGCAIASALVPTGSGNVDVGLTFS